MLHDLVIMYTHVYMYFCMYIAVSSHRSLHSPHPPPLIFLSLEAFSILFLGFVFCTLPKFTYFLFSIFPLFLESQAVTFFPIGFLYNFVVVVSCFCLPSVYDLSRSFSTCSFFLFSFLPSLLPLIFFSFLFLIAVVAFIIFFYH